MKRFVPVLIALYGLISYSQKEQEPKYELLEYGLAMNHNVRDFVDKKWRIKRIRVAGCVVTKRLRDSVENHNRTVWRKIALDTDIQNAEGIHHREVSRERQNFMRIRELIKNDEKANAIWKGLKRKKNYFLVIENHTSILPNIYEVTVKKWKRREDGKEKNQVFKMKVDLMNEEVKIRA